MSAQPTMPARPLGVERRGQRAATEPAAPTILHIDVADVVARVRAQELADETPEPFSAMETRLLDAAERCAAGDLSQPPRRELVAVALREARRQAARREVAERDSARAAEVVASLQAELRMARREADQERLTKQGLLLVHAELVAYLSRQFGCVPGSREVLDRVRAESERGA